MESTAQCDWEGGFLQYPSNEGQRPQWEAIKPLVLNLQTTDKTSPCAGREREREEGRRGRGRKGRWHSAQGPHSGSHASSTQWEHTLTDHYHSINSSPGLHHLLKGNALCHVQNTTRKPLSSSRTENCDSQCLQGHVQGRFVA